MRHPSQDFDFQISVVPEGVSPEDYMQEVLANCPCCQDARARGEEPVFIRGDAWPGPGPAPATPIKRQKVGRNSPCPCGSGSKYKRCCWGDA